MKEIFASLFVSSELNVFFGRHWFWSNIQKVSPNFAHTAPYLAAYSCCSSALQSKWLLLSLCFSPSGSLRSWNDCSFEIKDKQEAVFYHLMKSWGRNKRLTAHLRPLHSVIHDKKKSNANKGYRENVNIWRKHWTWIRFGPIWGNQTKTGPVVQQLSLSIPDYLSWCIVLYSVIIIIIKNHESFLDFIDE